VVVGHEGHPIVQLEAEGADCVIHEQHLTERVRADDAQVFDVDAGGGLRAVLAVKTELDEAVLWVQHLVNHCVRVVLRRRSEDADVEHAAQL
jgi:hypothetical protein